MRPASVGDYRELARRRLPRMLFDYIDGGAYAEATAARNVADFARIVPRQRVLKDMSALDMSVRTLGQTLSMPVGLAPVGMAGLYGRRGEVQAARAAAAAGVPFCLSTASVCSVEEVARAGTPPWFQLHVGKHRDYMKTVLQRARGLGCPVLVFTVDVPVLGARYRDVRSGFGLGGMAGFMAQARDALPRPGWVWDVWLRGRPHALGNLVDAAPPGQAGRSQVQGVLADNYHPSMTWDDFAWVRDNWDGPILVKGVLDAEDAREAVRVGAQGVIVSNHGGRQLDGVSSTIAALPRIAEAVGGQIDVYLDGGVRSGLDVLRALALGAKACFIGRPWAFALAAGGEAAIGRVLQLIRAELQVAMVLTGCRSIGEAGPHLLETTAR